jgi:hypothetical protein
MQLHEKVNQCVFDLGLMFAWAYKRPHTCVASRRRFHPLSDSPKFPYDADTRLSAAVSARMLVRHLAEDLVPGSVYDVQVTGGQRLV